MHQFIITLNEGVIILLKILLAVALSGLIGLEREHKHRPAGLRTHVLVCVGATLTMMISQFMVDKGLTTDIARLGAQVISGIGFLGAGTIIREGDRVRGLTTAATLWATACIGLAIGIGYYLGAVIAALTMLLVLRVLGYIMFRHDGKENLTIHIQTGSSRENTGKIMEVIHEYCEEVKNIEFAKDGINKEVTMTATVRLSRGVSYEEFSSALIELEEVYKVE